MKKSALGFTLLSMALAVSLAGCGKDNSASNSSSSTSASSSEASASPSTSSQAPASDKEVTITFDTASTVGYDAYKKLDMAGQYKKLHPNVTIEVIKEKDDIEQTNALKIRNAAGDLPDIVGGGLTHLEMFKDHIEPLNDLPAVADNEFAESFKIDGNVLGIPEGSNYDNIVYYNKDIFAEYNLSIPKTWDELIADAQKIKDGGKYIPIALGAKDAWPVFPFTESTPFLVSGDTDVMNKMGDSDAPFAKGGAFYTAYSFFKQLADIKPFGPDPLGTGFDQAKTMVSSKKAAMFFCSQWAAKDVLTAAGGNTASIGAFFPPYRHSTSDPMNVAVNPGGFIYISKDSKVKEEAKQFLSWYFSKDWQEQYMKELGINSNFKSVKVDLMPIIQEALDAVPDAHFIPMNLGNAEYVRISALAKFDTKVFGPEIVSGKDLDKLADDYNKAWKNAKAAK